MKPLTTCEIDAIEANLFPTARPIVRNWTNFPWHRDRAGAVTASLAASSQALAVVFGSSFVAVPVLLPPPPDEKDPWSGAVGPAGVTALAGAEIRPWLARAGALRAATSAFGETVLVREALGRRPLLRVVQSPAGAYGKWVGLPFDGAPPMVSVLQLRLALNKMPVAPLLMVTSSAAPGTTAGFQLAAVPHKPPLAPT